MNVIDVQKQSGEIYAEEMDNTVKIVGKGQQTLSKKPTLAFECIHTGVRFRMSVAVFARTVIDLGTEQEFFYQEEVDGQMAWHYDSSVPFHLSVKDWKPVISAPKAKATPKLQVAKKELTEVEKLQQQLAEAKQAKETVEA